MRSSTSSSDAAAGTGRVDRFTVVLLATVVAMLVLAEGVTRLYFDRVSKVHFAQATQRAALLEVNDSLASHQAHVAVLGNSLLLEGIDVTGLAESMGPQLVPSPYFVLATNYNDWFFGLKRLFAEGMRPKYVVVGLSPNQLSSPVSRGDYAAQYLFQFADLDDVVRDTHMDATTASGFYLSHFSKFYGTRSVTRGFVMGQLLPSVSQLLGRLQRARVADVPAGTLREVAAARLTALDHLCRENGAQFMLVVPPTYEDGAEIVKETGDAVHVTVLVPVSNRALDASNYQSDGYHLNEKGARVFTQLLGATLRDSLTHGARSVRLGSL